MANQETEIPEENVTALEDALDDSVMTEEQSKTFEDTFKENVKTLTEIIKNDPDKYYQCIAEIHVLLMMFEASMRAMMMNGGPKSLFRLLMGRK